jgi:hypothetical protein
MKLRNILRMQAMLVAFAAVMLMGTSAAAQEIENTVWADGPNVVPFAQPAPSNTVVVTNTENVTTTDGVGTERFGDDSAEHRAGRRRVAVDLRGSMGHDFVAGFYRGDHAVFAGGSEAQQQEIQHPRQPGEKLDGSFLKKSK